MNAHKSVRFEGIPGDMELFDSEDAGLLRPQTTAASPMKPEKRRGCFWASVCTSLGHVLLGTRLNVLLAFVPVAMAADALRLGKVRQIFELWNRMPFLLYVVVWRPFFTGCNLVTRLEPVDWVTYGPHESRLG